MRTTAPGQSVLLLLDLIDILNKKAIPYAVLGAFAASFYGVVRASLDADAVISMHTAEDTLKLCADLRTKGFHVEHRKGDLNDPISAVINIEDGFHNRVDLLIGIRGMAQEVFNRSQKAKFMDCFIQIIGLEDFIASKIFAGSPKDIEDVVGVSKVSGQKIDLNLLKSLVAAYGTASEKKMEELFN